METVGAERMFMAVGAQNRVAAIVSRLTTLHSGDTVVLGVVARATPGHTPGHMSFRVMDAATVIGDAVIDTDLSMVRPEWPSGRDHQQERAAATRVALLAELADAGEPVIGLHFPGTGIGRVGRGTEGYRLVAVLLPAPLPRYSLRASATIPARSVGTACIGPGG